MTHQMHNGKFLSAQNLIGELAESRIVEHSLCWSSKRVRFERMGESILMQIYCPTGRARAVHGVPKQWQAGGETVHTDEAGCVLISEHQLPETLAALKVTQKQEMSVAAR